MVQGIEPTWNPIKPIATQFAVDRNRTVQVERKQFPLRPAAAAAKTINRSQGIAENTIIIVVNFDTRKRIPHIHYVELSILKFRVMEVRDTSLRLNLLKKIYLSHGFEPF